MAQYVRGVDLSAAAAGTAPALLPTMASAAAGQPTAAAAAAAANAATAAPSVLPPTSTGTPPPSATPPPPHAAAAAAAPSSEWGFVDDTNSLGVSKEPVADGRFGSFYLQVRQWNGIDKPVVRAIRSSDCARLHSVLGTLALDVRVWAQVARNVVCPVEPCKLATRHSLVLLPLQECAFDLTLAEALAELETDERGWLSLLVDVATGVNEFHSRNIVHGRLTIGSSVVVSRDPGNSTCRFIAKVFDLNSKLRFFLLFFCFCFRFSLVARCTVDN